MSVLVDSNLSSLIMAASKNKISNDGFTVRLVHLLEAASLTQTAVAGALDVSQAAVSGWINGVVPVRRTAKALADALGVHVEWLLYGSGDKFLPGCGYHTLSQLRKPRRLLHPLSEESARPEAPALDTKTVQRLSDKMMEASTALGACAKILARSAGKTGKKKPCSAQSAEKHRRTGKR